MPRLLDALRTHLIGQGLVRKPVTAGVLPPMWLQPRAGVPGPGETPPGGTATETSTDLVVGAFMSGGFPVQRFQSEWRFPTVDLRIRSRTAPIGEDLGEAILAAVIDRTNWVMGGRLIIESQMWRALTPVDSDEQSFDYLAAVRFEIYAPQ